MGRERERERQTGRENRGKSERGDMTSEQTEGVQRDLTSDGL